VESDVTDVHSRSQGHAEGLNRPIQVLVIEGVLIVPDAATQVGYFITHEPDSIVAGVRLNLIHRRAGPSHDCRLHAYRRGGRRKREVRSSAHGKLTVGSIVVHVTFSGMSQAPLIFVRGHILSFGKISRACI
jgi:hypothetical protein